MKKNIKLFGHTQFILSDEQNEQITYHYFIISTH